ncbi:alpha/beta hydrolase [Erythrobacter longus]|nr:alpha/beta hydrolase [Erythrobacter longus]
MTRPSISKGVKLLGRTVTASLIAGLVATPILAERQDRMPRECRQEIRKLCGNDRGQMRECLRQRASELSEKCSGELRSRVSQRRNGEATSQTAENTQNRYRNARLAAGSILYGQSQRQQVDIYSPQDAVDDLPVILFVHGGGWSMGDKRNVESKPAHFTSAGYIFASTGYRLVPNVTVEDQAKDVGAAVQALVGQASAIGVDPNRVVLMGHSAGAHLAALVAADPKYAGDAFAAIKGVILLDGAGYDVAQSMEAAEPSRWQMYNAAFGNDPERQAALSPLTHVGGQDAPHWLALYVEDRTASRDQSQALVNALVEAGSSASAVPIADTNHSRMKRELGTPEGAAQTEAVDAFLEMVFN